MDSVTPTPRALQPPDLPPVTPESVRLAIAASNQEIAQVNAQTGLRIPFHPRPVAQERPSCNS